MSLGLMTIPIMAAGATLGMEWLVRRRWMDPRLIHPLLRTSRLEVPGPEQDVHVLLCVADHFEPKVGNAPLHVARARVARWTDDYPRQMGGFRDSDGRAPRHTFFYPREEYEAEFLDGLGELCRQGYGEVEVQLHHDHDTHENLEQTLSDYTHLLAEQHGLLACDRDTGETSYGFVHGNWALCNSNPDGSWCGVNNELGILKKTGCYADFTMPSAPHATQTRKINSIYYATDNPSMPKAHNWGQDVGAGAAPPNSLLLIQGPLVLDWKRRKAKVLPRLENGCLQASQPPRLERVWQWLQAGVRVPTRPDWYFVKLHTHGAPEDQQETLLGKPMSEFHQSLADHARANPKFHYHYVTAREMYNLVKAAEAGWIGSVAGALDYQMLWNGDSTGHFEFGKLAIDNGPVPLRKGPLPRPVREEVSSKNV